MLTNSFSINLNAKHMNGMTQFDLAVLSGKSVEYIIYYIRLFDTSCR